MYFEQPRIVRRWSDSQCLTGEEWIETSAGERLKVTSGSKAVTITPSEYYGSPSAQDYNRPLNRHDRRAAKKRARSRR